MTIIKRCKILYIKVNWNDSIRRTHFKCSLFTCQSQLGMIAVAIVYISWSGMQHTRTHCYRSPHTHTSFTASMRLYLRAFPSNINSDGINIYGPAYAYTYKRPNDMMKKEKEYRRIEARQRIFIWIEKINVWFFETGFFCLLLF